MSSAPIARSAANWPVTGTASPTSRKSSGSTRSMRSTRRRSTKNAAALAARPQPGTQVLAVSGVSGAGLPGLVGTARRDDPRRARRGRTRRAGRGGMSVGRAWDRDRPGRTDAARGRKRSRFGAADSPLPDIAAPRRCARGAAARREDRLGAAGRPRTARSAGPGSTALVDDVARCRAARAGGRSSSPPGAIAIGRRHLGLRGRVLRLEEKQAAAATGQIRLAHAYQEALARHGITVAQILLTPDDTEERRRHLNARATFAQLLALGAVPVVNENDTIATAEIRFGDNDRLAARVAQMTSADMLVLLSDIDGLYTADPRHDPERAPYPGRVARSAPRSRRWPARRRRATARAAWSRSSRPPASRCRPAARMLIAEGNPRGDGIRHRAARGDRGRARARPCSCRGGEPRSARKAWIAGAVNPAGTLIVDDGAARALRRRQEPAAGRRRRGRGRLRARRLRDRAHPRRRRDRARPVGLCERRHPSDRRPQER